MHAAHPQCRTTKTPKKKEGRKKEMGGEIPSISLSLPIRAWVVEAQRWMKKKESGGGGERGVLPLYLSLLLFLFLRFAPVFARGKKENTRGGVFPSSLTSLFRAAEVPNQKKNNKKQRCFLPIFFSGLRSQT